jgi:sigma-E factor negative regulatory protein RseC
VIEEIGVVKSVEGVIALVDVPRKSACDGCTAGTCRPEEKFMEIEAFNQIGAMVGQKVRIAVKPYTYIKGSIIVYGLPAVGLVIGAVFGKELMSKIFAATDSDILSAIFGFGTFAVSFFLVKIWTNAVGKKVESKPIIEEILH